MHRFNAKPVGSIQLQAVKHRIKHTKGKSYGMNVQYREHKGNDQTLYIEN
jgi:hypothetical protein